MDGQSRSLCDTTGYDEVSLSSLSSSDYTELPELLDNMLNWTEQNKVSVSLPSLRWVKIHSVSSIVASPCSSYTAYCTLTVVSSGQLMLEQALTPNDR